MQIKFFSGLIHEVYVSDNILSRYKSKTNSNKLFKHKHEKYYKGMKHSNRLLTVNAKKKIKKYHLKYNLIQYL